ncbi:hypothetical protein I4U23_027648 [Adineta vaga]|nr:hypothetical protein I4U23_027648 [Adineta vaga]
MTINTFKQSQQRVFPAITENRTSNRRKTFEIKLLKIILIQVFLSILLSLLRFGSFTYRNIVFNIITPTVAHRAAVVFAETLGGSLYFVNYALSFFVSIISKTIIDPNVYIYYQTNYGQ